MAVNPDDMSFDRMNILVDPSTLVGDEDTVISKIAISKEIPGMKMPSWHLKEASKLMGKSATLINVDEREKFTLFSFSVPKSKVQPQPELVEKKEEAPKTEGPSKVSKEINVENLPLDSPARKWAKVVNEKAEEMEKEKVN